MVILEIRDTVIVWVFFCVSGMVLQNLIFRKIGDVHLIHGI